MRLLTGDGFDLVVLVATSNITAAERQKTLEDFQE